LKLSQDDVLHVARLARLRVNKDEVARFCRDLSSVLAYMDMLREVDTGDVEATVHVQALVNVYREDAPRPSLALDVGEALRNAPRVHGNAFEVPLVMDED